MSEADGAVESERRGACRRDGSEPLVLVAVHDHHGVGAEKSSDWGHRGRVDVAVLERVVERVEKVHVRGAPERQPIATQQSLLGESGKYRIDGVAPAVRRRFDARHQQNRTREAGVHARIEVVGDFRPRRGKIVRPFHDRVDESTTDQRGQIDNGDHESQCRGDHVGATTIASEILE